MRQPVLMIVGKAGSGKDTLAGMLSKQSEATIVSLADPLKRIVRKLWPQITPLTMWGPSELRSTVQSDMSVRFTALDVARAIEDEGLIGGELGVHFMEKAEEWISSLSPEDLNPRRLLQTFGTDLIRVHLNDRVWFDKCASTILELQNNLSYDKVFGLFRPASHRLSAIVQDGRFINEVEAARTCKWFVARIKRPGFVTGSHVSETEQDGIPDSMIDFEVDNSDTLGYLSAQAERICEQICDTLTSQGN